MLLHFSIVEVVYLKIVKMYYEGKFELNAQLIQAYSFVNLSNLRTWKIEFLHQNNFYDQNKILLNH
jgi:hypothetical protein